MIVLNLDVAGELPIDGAKGLPIINNIAMVLGPDLEVD